MARTLLKEAFPAAWLNAAFARHGGRQYERDLLFSTVVELVALVRASAERLGPVLSALGAGRARLPGYALRVVEGNHLPPARRV